MDLSSPRRFCAILLAFSCLAGCAAPQPIAPQPSAPLNLTLYATVTPPPTPVPTSTVALVPILTATPVIYTVAQGDTLSAIASRLGLTVADLLAANPGLQPASLAVGQTLSIPPSLEARPTTLPAPVDLGRPQCFSPVSGVVCLAEVHNPGSQRLENVTVEFALWDGAGLVTGSQVAWLPLIGLPAGASLPAVAFFPAAVPPPAAVEVQLLSAVELTAADDRFIPAALDNLLVTIAWGGQAAQVTGRVFLPAESKPASTLWLAGTAYDAQGNLVGFRRWEWTGSLPPNTPQVFDFWVYSLGPPVARVGVLVEARP